MNKIYAICVYTSLLMLSSIQVMGSNLNFIEPLTPTNVDTHLLQQQLASSQITNAQKQLLVELRTMVEEHSSEAAQLFFDHGDDLEITIVKVLPWAVVRDYIKIVKYICEKCVQDVQAMALLNMHEVFAMAAHYGNISSMQYFLERYGQNEFGLEALGIYEVLTKAVNDDFDAVAFIL